MTTERYIIMRQYNNQGFGAVKNVFVFTMFYCFVSMNYYTSPK